MAVSVCRILALTLTFFVVLQEGCGLPLSDLPTTAPQKHHIRAKRCSCNSWLDKECIYFCHLDIIWVNTPSKILPYGIGSPLSRRRRSAGRCECANQADQNCYNFCHHSSENPTVVVAGGLTETDVPSDTNSNKLLAYLRSVIRSNLASVKQVASPRKKLSRASRLKIR